MGGGRSLFSIEILKVFGEREGERKRFDNLKVFARFLRVLVDQKFLIFERVKFDW